MSSSKYIILKHVLDHCANICVLVIFGGVPVALKNRVNNMSFGIQKLKVFLENFQQKYLFISSRWIKKEND